MKRYRAKLRQDEKTTLVKKKDCERKRGRTLKMTAEQVLAEKVKNGERVAKILR